MIRVRLVNESKSDQIVSALPFLIRPNLFPGESRSEFCLVIVEQIRPNCSRITNVILLLTNQPIRNQLFLEVMDWYRTQEYHFKFSICVSRVDTNCELLFQLSNELWMWLVFGVHVHWLVASPLTSFINLCSTTSLVNRENARSSSIIFILWKHCKKCCSETLPSHESTDATCYVLTLSVNNTCSNGRAWFWKHYDCRCLESER